MAQAAGEYGIGIVGREPELSLLAEFLDGEPDDGEIVAFRVDLKVTFMVH